MIIGFEVVGFAVITILALIACALLYAAEKKVKKLSNELFDERTISSTLRNEKHHEWERAGILQEEVIALKTSNQELKDDIKRLSEQGKEVKETGNLYKTRHHQRATPDVYQAVFELTTNGQRVLQSLVAQYSGNAYTSDQNGGERETCRKLGQAEVINFINYQIYKANNPHLFPEQVIEND